MSAYPLMLEGTALSALVVGGGRVATRKVNALVAAGASVRVLAPDVSAELEALAANHTALRVIRGEYAIDQLGDALFVVAATNNARVNAQIARDARARGRLVNVASAPELGNAVTPAVHRAGDIVIAVATGGVPTAAARIRDALGRTVDTRYAAAVGELSSLRQSLLDTDQRDRWTKATAALIGPDFCEHVESGTLTPRVDEWR
ncbi:MAG: bifunctional precorrin-2 dehydrogenase/sirohydrochlorin ferrochelatase [bacterium]